MRASAELSYFAVDGGGTLSRYVLRYAGTRHVATGGATNVSTDFEASLAVLTQGLRDVAERAETTLETVMALPGFIGVAGVTGPEMAHRVDRALALPNAMIADDRPAALRGALGARDGAIGHFGTGSFFASRIGETQSFAGGWGSVLGDEASAMWVGRRLLSYTVRAIDGTVAHSDLTRHVLDRHRDGPGIVRFAAGASPADLGALARLVTGAAKEGDTVAAHIMEAAAYHVEEGIRSVGWQPGMALCLTGGLGPFYTDFLPEHLRAALRAPEGEPADGAETLALEHARRTVT
ncbi:MAG: BadF/BadG/BcrA/BcrD ATPase family protein [Pseudomonadota bacterium]